VRELCTFADGPDLARALRSVSRWGARAVVVHLGAKGSGYYADGRLLRSPCVRAARVVNATGTGDLLSVVMILLHRRGGGVTEKLHMANRIVSDYVSGAGLFGEERGAFR
jgi:sugar/nucleoside kinase (ribokinase family)